MAESTTVRDAVLFFKTEKCFQNYSGPFSFARLKENGQKENDVEIEICFLKEGFGFRISLTLH